ncbi:GMC family oxidoreductase [Paenibacillus sp. HN-1]|uniref:GMC oxidoreductase n=2 Tax=Paenibacillus TaxID=44249 RepID=UPI001CA975F2|nr:GMC oxidoreductase [Paenibacillus sp. CGMCC 1.18879]MBY9080703.1 GMC family oxidoreductase [Paenibacillus sp. CGMCC 1.18879]MBY9085352.1 GMC family oxidoreductase [Paenibacillus sinensis]
MRHIPYCPLPTPTRENTWIPVISLDEMASREYDVLVVGTGAGGGAALWRLCEQLHKTNKRIGVVERGGLLLPTNAFNIPTGTTAGSLYNNPQIGIRLGDALPQFPGTRLVYALGGRTLFWGAVCPRIPDFELASWPVPIPEMHRYYSIAERMMNVTDLYSRYSTFTQNLLDRLRANGYPEAVDQPVGIDLQPTQYGELHTNAYFSSISLLARAMHLHPYDLAVNAQAIQVLTDQNQRTRGIRVITPERTIYELRSKTVVLAASALETPRILLNSGIPGRAIGHYLTNHSIVRGVGQISSTDLPEILGMINILVPQTWYRPIQLQMFGAYYSYQFQTKPRVNKWDDNVLITLGKVQSRYENRMFLDPNRQDAYGLPELQVQFSYSPTDWAIIEESAAALRDVASLTGLKLDLTAEGSDVCLFLPGADNHESGTCRMGNDPWTSVTNPIGSVHGITGLYITDNSVLPSMGAVNPTLSTVALAIRTADYIASECRIGQ